MTDQFFIGQLITDNHPSVAIILRWTLTTGQFSSDQQLYNNLTTEWKEKIKSPRFAFLKISASVHCTHLQSRTYQPAAQALQKSAVLQTLNIEYS